MNAFYEHDKDSRGRALPIFLREPCYADCASRLGKPTEAPAALESLEPGGLVVPGSGRSGRGGSVHRTRRIDDGNPAAQLSGRRAADGQLVEIDRHQASRNGWVQASDHPEVDGPRLGHLLSMLVADQRDDAL
jgi:hypothetical protein